MIIIIKTLCSKLLRNWMFVLLAGFASIGCKVNEPAIDQAQVSSDSIDTTKVDEQVNQSGPQEIYLGTRTRLHDLLHTKLEVRFDWEKQRLEGKATLQVVPYFYPQDQLMLDALNFNIHSVNMLEGKNTRELKYYYDKKHLFINLDSTYTREQSCWLEIIYTAKPTEREVSGGEAITSDQGLYFINHDGSDPDKPMQIGRDGVKFSLVPNH